MHPRFIDHLDVRCLPDGENWMALHEIRYVCANGEVIYIPGGAISDFASIPKFFRRIAQPATGKHRRGAFVHDWIYRTADLLVSKERGDNIFLEIMVLDQTEVWVRNMMYQAVDKFGHSSYVPRELAT